MTALFYAHSGLRYLVLLTGVVALLYSLYAFAARRPVDRTSNVLGAVFAGTLDLQILLGLILLAMGLYYPALIGHITMMLLAAGAAHGAAVMARRAPEPRRHHLYRLLGVLLALALILGGILAIGRSVFGTGAPSLIE